MTVEQLRDLPPWYASLAWTVVTLLTAYLVSRVLTRVVDRRLSAWAVKTHWKWNELVIDALKRGLPLWSVLVGTYVAVGFWPLPEHIFSSVTRGIQALIWLSVTFISAGLIGQLIVVYSTQFSGTLPAASVTQNVAKLIVVILGLLMILNGLGISITPLLTALGVGGLAVALALQDTLSNLFSGVYLTMAKQIRIGDYVKLESGEEGYVDDIGWRATKIRMLPNNMVLVPNNKLGQTIITNYYLPNKELAVLVNVGVDYSSNLDHVERVTCEVAREVMREVPGGVPGFEPFVRYHTLGDFSINFTVILRGKEFVDQYLIKHEFLKRLIGRYREEGITIPFPTRTVLTKDAD